MPVQSTIEPEIAVRNAYIEGAKAMLAIMQGADSSEPILIESSEYTSAQTAVLSAIEARSADGIVYRPVQMDAALVFDDEGDLERVALDEDVVLPETGLCTVVVSLSGTSRLALTDTGMLLDHLREGLETLAEKQNSGWITEIIAIRLP